jgi:hypothetical protein
MRRATWLSDAAVRVVSGASLRERAVGCSKGVDRNEQISKSRDLRIERFRGALSRHANVLKRIQPQPLVESKWKLKTLEE